MSLKVKHLSMNYYLFYTFLAILDHSLLQVCIQSVYSFWSNRFIAPLC